MKVSQVFSGEYLTAADLQGAEPAVVIESVELKEFDDGNKFLLTFQGKKKGLVANKTNSKRIAALYGDDTDGWLGREIILYTDQVDYAGKTVDAIRVRGPKREVSGDASF
jgi:hypothetical protein